MILTAALATVAGCHKPPVAVVDPCPPLALVQHYSLDSYAGQRDRTEICVKTAARDLTRAGGSVQVAAQAAVDKCAPEEADMFKALGKEDGKVWAWERTRLHADFVHLASLTATQARAIGCGRPPGAPPDTL